MEYLIDASDTSRPEENGQKIKRAISALSVGDTVTLMYRCPSVTCGMVHVIVGDVTVKHETGVYILGVKCDDQAFTPDRGIQLTPYGGIVEMRQAPIAFTASSISLDPLRKIAEDASKLMDDSAARKPPLKA